MPPAAAAAPTPARTWLGFALFYATTFATLAVFMQFFPGWLHATCGLTEAQVSVVLAAQTIARTLLGTHWAHLVDRLGDPRRVLVGLSCASVGAFALFGASQQQALLWGAAFAFGSVFSPMYPICDAAALQASSTHGFSFGRLRMVGSITYLLAILAVGALLDRTGIGPTFALLVVGTLAIAGSALLLPRPAAAAAPRERDPSASPWRELFASRGLWLVLAASALIQGSHATYYNLSTMHWEDHGIGKSLASVVWAEGILAEIVLFWCARGSIERLRPTTLMLVGAAAAVVRWCVVAATTEPAWLLATAWLHALTFGCTYLGTLRALERRVPARLRATAQGLLGAATSGVGMVVCGLAGGFAYDLWAGRAFFVMAAFAAAGLLCAWKLRVDMDHATATAPSASQTDAAR